MTTVFIPPVKGFAKIALRYVRFGLYRGPNIRGGRMKWLLRGDTRQARIVVLKLRFQALRYGDDFAETYLAIDAAIYGLVLLFPGDTMGHAEAWSVIARLTHGDLGLGVLFTILAAGLWLSLFRLIPNRYRRGVLVATFAVWVGMSVGFFAGYPSSLGPWIAVLNALTAWVAYLRTDR